MNPSELYLSVLASFPDVLTVEELSKALHVSTKTAYRLVRENKIRFIKIGRSYRIPKAHLLTYLKLV
ncbi:MAG: helix-turn-helix domain-containing protein, partial [Oscillospiraceae bacterium]|nr:helix-turn-helix domain-containing protein [Oscillospiraceae bacterium]